jgi:hypothetical protein
MGSIATANDASVDHVEKPAPVIAASTADAHWQLADTSWDGYKTSDGSYDLEKVFREFGAERDAATDLRNTLEGATKKPDKFSAKDLAVDIPDDERAAMDDLVNSFNEFGISRDQADKIFGKFAALISSEQQQKAEAEAQ